MMMLTTKRIRCLEPASSKLSSQVVRGRNRLVYGSFALAKPKQ
jgi:hypothetical protein